MRRHGILALLAVAALVYIGYQFWGIRQSGVVALDAVDVNDAYLKLVDLTFQLSATLHQAALVLLGIVASAFIGLESKGFVRGMSFSLGFAIVVAIVLIGWSAYLHFPASAEISDALNSSLASGVAKAPSLDIPALEKIRTMQFSSLIAGLVLSLLALITLVRAGPRAPEG